MLRDLDKKLDHTINRKIQKLEDKKKFNFFNSEMMSIGWIFAFNIFVFVFIGHFLNKFLNRFFNCNNKVFLIILYLGINLSFFNLFKILKKHKCI